MPTELFEALALVEKIAEDSNCPLLSNSKITLSCYDRAIKIGFTVSGKVIYTPDELRFALHTASGDNSQYLVYARVLARITEMIAILSQAKSELESNYVKS